MAFKGIFVGIDRYASPLISNLSCSLRDAQALYSLFCDSFSLSDVILLVNEQATRAAVTQAILDLHAQPGDVVVLAFSGHGSDSHHLITYDADPFALDATSIHLDELTRLFSRIQAANLLLLLDCCFAGGAGSKVFHAPVASKSMVSADALLNKVCGKGRLIFTASTAEQEAIEDRRRGHGLFTYYVLEALRGAPEVARAGQVPVLPLVDFVTRSVVEAARQIRHRQEPSLRGTVEGEFSLPVLKRGPAFSRFFPEHHPIAVGPGIEELAGFGFPPQLLAILRNSIPALNQLQQDAINRLGLFEGQHLVVSAPTSSGKTLIGELAAIYRYTQRDRTYMLLPLRALVNDKYVEFTAKYSNFGLRIIRSTGEISDENDALLRGKFDVALLTYERFAALAVTVPHILRQVGLVVVDEVQMITDKNRGANLEFMFTLLKSQRLLGVEPQLISLSAVIGDVSGFDSWLNSRLLISNKRPVPLDEGLLDMQGTFRYLSPDGSEESIYHFVSPEYRRGSSQDIIIPLVRKLVSSGEKVIVFRETKPIVRATAEYLKHNLGLPPATETLSLLPEGDPSVASMQLRSCLENGVAFHNADLDIGERFAIETTFRDPESSLQVLVATTTLAMGVNTPAWSVVIAGLEHPDSPYSVAEYKNMAGRAGRLGFTQKGKSFLIAPTSGDAYQLWNQYVLGKPEALISRFGDQEPLSLICRVLATAGASKIAGMATQELIDFIGSTFGAYQQGLSMSEATVVSVLHRLEEAGLVEEVDDRFRLTELGKIAGTLAIQVESVVRVGRALRGLSGSLMTGNILLAATQTTVELDEVIFPIHKRSVQERQRWRGVIADQGLPMSVRQELRATDDAGYTSRCKRLAAVQMWLEGVELSRIEAAVLRHLPGDNAAGPIRASAERTRDLFGVVARIGSLLSSDGAETPADVDEIGLRLELGIPKDIAWLARELKRGLERGDYLALRREGLTSSAAIDAADDTQISRAVNSSAKLRRIREAVVRIKSTQTVLEADTMPMLSGDL